MDPTTLDETSFAQLLTGIRGAKFPDPINGANFLACVEQRLVQFLRAPRYCHHGQLGKPQSKAMRAAIKAAGARLWFLPPTPRNSIPWNRASLRSNTGCAWPRNDTCKTYGATSDVSSESSKNTNAQATSGTQDTLPTNGESL